MDVENPISVVVSIKSPQEPIQMMNVVMFLNLDVVQMEEVPKPMNLIIVKVLMVANILNMVVVLMV